MPVRRLRHTLMSVHRAPRKASSKMSHGSTQHRDLEPTQLEPRVWTAAPRSIDFTIERNPRLRRPRRTCVKPKRGERCVSLSRHSSFLWRWLSSSRRRLPPTLPARGSPTSPAKISLQARPALARVASRMPRSITRVTVRRHRTPTATTPCLSMTSRASKLRSAKYVSLRRTRAAALVLPPGSPLVRPASSRLEHPSQRDRGVAAASLQSCCSG